MKYKKCEIKWKVIENSQPDFGKFLSNKEMDTIFFLNDKFRNKKIMLSDGEYYDFILETDLAKSDTLIKRFVAKDFNDFIVVEPYIEGENGNYLADYKHFAVIHPQSTGKFIINLKVRPDESANGLLCSDKYNFWCIERNGYYYLHYHSVTMELDMRAFCFRSAASDVFEYSESFIEKQKQIEDDNEKALYLKLKNKFESAA